MAMSETPDTLKRAVGPVLLTLYGVGVTVGAGIYVLVGKVAGEAGMAAPVAFLIAGILAGLSALSYSEMATRFPRAGGEATYVNAGFGLPWVTLGVGLLVVFTGVSSAAAVLLGFVGYLNELVAVPTIFTLVGVVAVLGAITFWGVAQSLVVVALTTLLEIGGLLLVIGAGLPSFGNLPAALPEMWPGLDAIVWLAVLSSSVLAFFAFIGFEDIVNMAEEVREPDRSIPRAIIATLLISTGLYIALAIVSVLTIAPEVLAQSDAPLALVFGASGGNADILSSIAILAVVNGALIQIIMASRLIYGLARLGRLPAILGHVNARTRTPDVAILVVMAIVLVFAISLPIVELASYASLAVLLVFTSVNVALLVMRRRPDDRHDGFRVPIAVPVVGALASFGLFVFGAGQQVAPLFY